MTEAANEIAKIAQQIVERKGARQPSAPSIRPSYVHITGLPETAYERLVGREVELKRLDETWADRKTNILSLVAEGGAGKSALVNEWLKTSQADNYRGAEAVLGWSFYSQGSKERATSADEFLNWVLNKLGLNVETMSDTVKGDAIAEEMAKRRVLLVLDGVEPLQHGPGTQTGQLKDLGLRALLRRFAAVPPAEAHGLIVLTSRLAIQDIARWKDSAAPVVGVDKLSVEAGAALLRDNGVWGTDKELQAASHDFDGHPLALDLLASFVKETQFGDVRRRDHIRAFFADPENPRHDHAKRVMESLENEWLADQPVLFAIMHMVGLFDRPASGDCLRTLRKKPAIEGLTDAIVDLDEDMWQRATSRLREVRLLAPKDRSAPSALDTHPLVREWFGERLIERDEKAWRAAHLRLYLHLRDTTWEGHTPTLEDLAPLFQALVHGCRARRHDEVLKKIYRDRICRKLPSGKLEFYTSHKLGAPSSALAALSWFFDKPYETPIATLGMGREAGILSEAAFLLRTQGRLAEALQAQRTSLQRFEAGNQTIAAALGASSLSETELLLGDVGVAVATAARAVELAMNSTDKFRTVVSLVAKATALHVAGRRDEAQHQFAEATRQQQQWQPDRPALYGMQGYRFCDLLVGSGDWTVARDQAAQSLKWGEFPVSRLASALDRLMLGRAHLGLALQGVSQQKPSTQVRDDAETSRTRLDEATDDLHVSGRTIEFLGSLLARAAFRRSVGDWYRAARDLDEIEEIAEFGPMKLHLCDMALERARLCFARIAAFAPLNGILGDRPPNPVAPDALETARLTEEARTNLSDARKLITECGYYRRGEELDELAAVLAGRRRFADLPPRV